MHGELHMLNTTSYGLLSLTCLLTSSFTMETFGNIRGLSNLSTNTPESLMLSGLLLRPVYSVVPGIRPRTTMFGLEMRHNRISRVIPAPRNIPSKMPRNNTPNMAVMAKTNSMRLNLLMFLIALMSTSAIIDEMMITATVTREDY
jgi:hypothetical protein